MIKIKLIAFITIIIQLAFGFLHNSHATDQSKACASVCRLAEASHKWLNDSDRTPDDKDMPLQSWQFAIRSLGALFIVKSASFCPNVRNKAQGIFRQIALLLRETRHIPVDRLLNGCSREARPFATLQALANATLRANNQMEQSSLDEWGKLFYLELLRTAGSNPTLLAGTELKSSDFELERIRVETSLRVDLRLAAQTILNARTYPEAKPALIGQNKESIPLGSKFNTFLTGAATISTNEAAGINLLKAAIEDFSLPFDINYHPFGKKDGWSSTLGSVARAVPTHLAFYILDNGTEHGKERQYLKKAIKALIDNREILITHAERNEDKYEFHNTPDGLSPVYLYSSIYYAALGLKALSAKSDPSNDKEEIQALSNRLQELLLSRIDDDGLFTPLGNKTRPSSPAYVNPLAGLALLSVSACGI